MKKLRKIAMLGAFLFLLVPSLSQAWYGNTRLPNLPYVYSPCSICHGFYYGKWYLGYRVGFDSCDVLVGDGVIVRVYRYFPA